MENDIYEKYIIQNNEQTKLDKWMNLVLCNVNRITE